VLVLVPPGSAGARLAIRRGGAGEGAGSWGGPGVRGADAGGGADAGVRGVREPGVAAARARRAAVGGGVRAGVGQHRLLRTDATQRRAPAGWLPPPARALYPPHPAAATWRRSADAAGAGENQSGPAPGLAVSALDFLLPEHA
jgi:hypothetical protein